MGYTPLEVGKEKKGLNLEINVRKAKVKLKDLSVFSRQFATMINSGLPILRALSILSEQTENKLLAETLTACRMDVEQGSSLSGAMQKHPKVFNDLYISMVKSGEMGGSLDTTLLKLAAMLEARSHLRGKIKSAMTYPVVVVGLVLLIMSAMLLFIVPQFKGIYGQLGGTLPLPTRSLITMSDLMKQFWYIFVGRVLHRAVLLPPVQEDRERPHAGRPPEAAGAGLRAPVPQDGAGRGSRAPWRCCSRPVCRSCRPSTSSPTRSTTRSSPGPSPTCSRACARASRSRSRCAKHPVFPPMVVQMIAVGEETGQVDTMLTKVAQFYDQEVEASVDALTSLIEPLLIAVIGGFVGAAVIALYMPMFNIIKLIK